MDTNHLHNPQLALACLLLAGGASAPRRRLLLEFNDPLSALRAGPPVWNRHGCSALQQARLQRPDCAQMERIQCWLQHPGHHLLGLHEPDYPMLLRKAPGSPLALFIDGDPQLLWQPSVAVVGSRNPSAGGHEHAHRFATALARAGLVVTSGMAAGIDAAAHLAALEQQRPTIAVIATGPDLAYPPRHRELRDRIAQTGAVVSEYPPGAAALRSHFPARNRLIAGLSLATLVIEAALRSGALITARLAAEAGREVFALPGSIDNPLSRGCHRLLRDGAGLVEEPGEVITGLGSLPETLAAALRGRLGADTDSDAGSPATANANAAAAANAAASAPADLAPQYHLLWQAMGSDPTSMDTLVERTGLTTTALSSMLLAMELEGRIVVEHGRYSRRSGFLHLHSVRSDAGRGQ